MQVDKRWFALLLRVVFGTIFIWASIDKIHEPAKFAEIIYGYYLLPGSMINLVAVFLPFVELVAGLFLVLGIYPKSALTVLNTLIAVFIVAITINLVRGHEFDCGCFTLGSPTATSSTVWLLIRDILILTCGILLFWSFPGNGADSMEKGRVRVV